VIKLPTNKKVFLSALVSIFLLPLVLGLQTGGTRIVGVKENCSTSREATDAANSADAEVSQGNLTGNFQGGSQMLQFSSLSSSASFTRHLMCKDYNLSYYPIEPTTIFSPSDTRAVCLMTVSMNISDVIEWRWYYRNDSSDTWVFCPVPYENRSYIAKYYGGEQYIAGYLNITGCWPGVNYPRAYKVEVYYFGTSLLFSEYFEVTNGGLNSPRMCKDVDVNGNPVNITSRFTIDNDTRAYHYLRFDNIAYFNEELRCCHNFTTVWIQPNGSTYNTYAGDFRDYKDKNVTWTYWKYGAVSDDYIDINSSTPVGNWTVEVYLDNYLDNDTWMNYGPVATTPFIVGNETVADWTFMVYLDADNTLENASINVFLKMANVSSSSRVNVVVQMDRTGYDDRYGNWTDCKRFNITKGMTPTPENATLDLGEVDMGDPDTLKDFVNWTMSNYPANYYFLVLWDHGAGFIGCCLDVTNSSDILTLPELSQALGGLPVIMDVVFIDACTMAMPEVAYQIKDCANVLIGPEGDGYEMVDTNAAPYDDYLSSLISNSSMSPTEFAKEVVNNYIGWCNSVPVPNATMSATDLTKIMSLTAAIDDFAINLKEKETPYHEEISQARSLTQGYEGPFTGYTGYYIDLYHFAQLTYGYVPDAGLQDAANQMMAVLSPGNVIIMTANKADPNSHGLSIFFPDSKGKYDYLKSIYEKVVFAIDTPWDEFLRYHLSGYVLMIQTTYPGIPVKVDEDSYVTDAYGEIPVFVLPGNYIVNVTTPVSTGFDSREVFTQWKDGSTTNPRTVSVSADSTVGAEYVTQYRLIINANFGTTNPVAAEYWYANASNFLISASPPSTIDGEQYVWLGWTGTGPGSYSGTDKSASVAMNGPINETATWRHEYLLTVTSPHGSPTPTSGWFEAGTSINGSVTSPVEETAGMRYVCTGWTGTGSAPESGTSTTVNFTIDRPSSIVWSWKTQYHLTVSTDPTGLNPQPDLSPPGSWYDNWTLVNCTAQGVSGYAFDHWTVDGASWAVGINPVPVTMDGAHEATAHYVRVRAWWETLFSSENLQVILGVLGTVLTVGLLGGAWVRSRKRMGVIKAFLDEIDEVYSRNKMNPRKCEEELYRLRNTILEGLTDGKITEEHYDILDKKIDKYMKELEEEKKRKPTNG
jgi:hypothetical protein